MADPTAIHSGSTSILHAGRLLAQYMPEAVEYLHSVMVNEDIKDELRIEAARIILTISKE
jgi:hypothetical protein